MECGRKFELTRSALPERAGGSPPPSTQPKFLDPQFPPKADPVRWDSQPYRAGTDGVSLGHDLNYR
ncbi:hypothetical protein FOPG_17692 [Fusarium oxysporum f. sp. conglutinans race 2 54008]|uniref:Uncharacterized protein n=1 Tax=Fusarium oxysporum f. sp. conglutinans race 2 54008 TaxID=1089457 RepID=X0H225_FUSOX|nr:hypothetical protein FOPG_17692 [Fusarium oxysporum f. sp. conglutinans race 2 54008]